MNKCPDEHILNDYLTAALAESDREKIENHIADCPYCIYRIAEAYEVLNESRFNPSTWLRVDGERSRTIKSIKEFFMNARIKLNLWLVGCIIMFLLSFLVQRYFLQFLVGAILLGAKWIIDSKNTKMLIMIYDAWKRGGRKEAAHILESLDSRMKR